ncbi:23S rRNA m(5)U-1939 methyltransferase [Salsuginibacillus halophilus]|uniref:23S rRNA m(5)U-1939 methyltransferase n=1 Tax=Salsuginibacillus halophilus TaxID=517424 RepID=A0A2P8HEB0_9BACI|nr:23S rRNA (uracil(1939)-C(5))-methyltransferase RlmD [Salsuginibacillus halophilus]PSL44501.1 23S rRNA m(5)U-1939 methyltransferase [Salsuginibacillus halophilus]
MAAKKADEANTPVQKNQYVNVRIEDLTHEGAGVAKVQGYTLFVPYALPGENVQVKVTKTKKNFGFARLIEVTSESRHRVEPPCPIYKRCGGCQLQHMSYEGQLHAKQKQVQDAMKKIAGFEEINVHPTLGMTSPWRYRNKAQVPVGESSDGLIAGFYQKGTHDIIDMDSCIIQAAPNDEAVQITKNILDEHGISAYDETTGRGLIRHVVARYAATTEQLMIVLVLNGKELPREEKILNAMEDRIPGLASIVQNVNTAKTNVVFGDQTTVLWGEPYIYDEINGVQFAISARSFYQVNPMQTEVLYKEALHAAQLTGTETVIDAYCGIGTISLFLAEKAAHVYGVDVVDPAIADATRNAKLNGLTNVDFAVGEAENVMPFWHAALGIQPDVIVVDPPRKGCDEKLLDAMVKMQPKRIVYVSCNPATLARDMARLAEAGYKPKDVQPVDMFPQTVHVESVVALEKTV